MPLSRYLPYIAAHTCGLPPSRAFARNFGIRRLSSRRLLLALFTQVSFPLPSFYSALFLSSFPDNAYIALQLTDSSCLITNVARRHSGVHCTRNEWELAVVRTARKKKKAMYRLNYQNYQLAILIHCSRYERSLSAIYSTKNITLYLTFCAVFNLPARDTVRRIPERTVNILYDFFFTIAYLVAFRYLNSGNNHVRDNIINMQRIINWLTNINIWGDLVPHPPSLIYMLVIINYR